MFSKKSKSERLVARGNKYLDNEKYSLAIRNFKKSISLTPDWSVPHYNIGLIYKNQKNWKLSQEYNIAATNCNPDDDASWWNLAISSTGILDWMTARKAWNQVGFQYKIENNEIIDDLGQTPVRIFAENCDPEVVWALRIDPCRAEINNIPYTETGFCYGDLVLHDGAANGYRMNEGVKYPVFDVFEITRYSDYDTYELVLPPIYKESVFNFEKEIYENSMIIEIWSESIIRLCKQCSEGTPHDNHDDSLISEDNDIVIAISSNIKNTKEIIQKALDKFNIEPKSLILKLEGQSRVK